MIKRQKYPNIKPTLGQLERLRKMGDLSQVSAEYGDGRFIIDSNGVMPAGVQIEYEGTLRLKDKIQGMEYFVGNKTIIMVSLGKEIKYTPILFKYDGLFKPTKLAVVDWNYTMLTCVPSDKRNNYIWGNWGGLSNEEESLSNERALWKDVGSKWSDYGIKRVSLKGPRKSK